MNGFLYTLTLQEPLLANSLGGEPNSAESLFYVPGGAVRGAFIQAFGGEPDAANEEFRRLFLTGETRFLNAYPLYKGKRTLPPPFPWQVERKPAPDAKEKKIYRDITCAPKNDKGEKLDTKSPSFSFWTIARREPEGQPAYELLASVNEKWQVNIHTQRDVEKGRATIENGAVYRYIALPAGMKLQGAVLTRTPKDGEKDDAETLRELFGAKAEILLGKARTAGYGAVTLEIADLGDWREYEPVARKDGITTLTLLSPSIVRDENGQCGLEIEPALGGLKAKAVSRKETIIAGFNRKWGLPLPKVTAIAAGSVFTVENATAEQLRVLEERGIGERRAEGFGRVAINLDLPAAEMKWEGVEIESAPTAGTLPANDPLARLMLTRLLRRDLDEKIIEAAREMTKTYSEDVPNSQISRWRAILRDCLPQRDIARMQKFCEDNRNKPGWKKMEKARIQVDGQSQRLTGWIESALEQPAALYTALGLDPGCQRGFGPDNSVKTEELNAEYRLRLMDAVLVVMSKKNGKGGAND